ncbi:MAG: hypothetical protein M1820_010783 [Bogoriella megaspora]|nr:MAG: hypothetical protein M1820_010783 [Bogoriella megaspora]
MADTFDLDTDRIKTWRSIITLIVFVGTNIIVLFPFHIPFYIPRSFANAVLDTLSSLRIISPRERSSQNSSEDDSNGKVKPYMRLNFPMNFVTAPLIADLFLLAILAIGRDEVHDGTIGAENIQPIDIMLFFLSLAYIAISIDASGLIRYLAFRVLQWGGDVGHRLFFYLYAFFFGLASFIGNDPIILSGTAFLAYMTRVSSNIVHPRAWIHTQFAVANIASAILVSSNPTNLVLAGAFNITFIKYTANIIIPVIITGIVLFPFLLYIVFADERLIPQSIQMHELPEEARGRKPVNPNIPNARGDAEEQENALANGEQGKLLSLEEIMNPFVDKKGAAFGAIIMAATLITLVAVNAVSEGSTKHQAFWVTLPAAFVMLCWDVGFGFFHRRETREIAKEGRRKMENARAERLARDEEARKASLAQDTPESGESYRETRSSEAQRQDWNNTDSGLPPTPTLIVSEESGGIVHESLPSSPARQPEPHNDIHKAPSTANVLDEKQQLSPRESEHELHKLSHRMPKEALDEKSEVSLENQELAEETSPRVRKHTTLVSLVRDAYRWSQETLPTATTVLTHLPYALVPFAFSMFVLVQALVTKGWVPVFAYGWDHWVDKTGTVGAVGGMAFLSVILCNFAGTNIGTTILLSRVIQAWEQIHFNNGKPISDRTFWATIYSMALGVNYGAFSAAFSASLAGLLWRDILGRKHIRVLSLEFARVNLPIIAIAMIAGCVALVAEVYIIRDTSPYIK